MTKRMKFFFLPALIVLTILAIVVNVYYGVIKKKRVGAISVETPASQERGSERY